MLNEIIERLEEYRGELGGDCKVRMMMQQNWPFENAITGLVSGAEFKEADEEDGRSDGCSGIVDQPGRQDAARDAIRRHPAGDQCEGQRHQVSQVRPRPVFTAAGSEA